MERMGKTIPIAGIICPLDGNFHYFEDCQATHSDPNAFSCNAPRFLLNELAENDSKRKDAKISTTVLTGCARAFILKNTRPYFINPVQGWNMARGTWAHSMFEKGAYGPEFIIEQRISKPLDIDGRIMYITGKPDEVNSKDGILIDYKTKHTIPTSVSFDHEAQFNVYAWLLQGGQVITRGKLYKQTLNVQITRGGIHYVSWQPKTPWRRIKVPIWDTATVENWLIERVRPIAEWEQTGVLPECNRMVAYGRCDCDVLESTHHTFWKEQGFL